MALPTNMAATCTVFRLVSVNTAPEHAKRLIGHVIEDVKDRYTIVHVANVESACASLCKLFLY